MYKPEINKNVTSLRCSRLMGTQIRTYDTIMFPENPIGYIKMWINRLKVFGFPDQKDTSGILLELLDDDDTILQEIMISHKQFEYLRRKLRLRRVQ